MNSQTEETNIGIRIGAFAPKIKTQLQRQGYKFKKGYGRKAGVFDRYAQAISNLGIAGFLTESQVTSAGRKMVQSLVKHIESDPKSEVKGKS